MARYFELIFSLCPEQSRVRPTHYLYKEFDISKKAEDCISDIFLDPTGNHLIVKTKTLEYHYINGVKKPKVLSKFKGIDIRSVAWGPVPYHGTEIIATTTIEILLGTADGAIYESVLEYTDEYFKREEKYFKLVCQCSDRLPIDSIYYEYGIAQGSDVSSRWYFVFFNCGNRLFHHVARQPTIYPPSSTPIFENVFTFSHVTIQELPGEEGFVSKLAFYPSPDANLIPLHDTNNRLLYSFSPVKNFAWLTGNYLKEDLYSSRRVLRYIML
jgi:hypothetical protein